MSTVKRLALAIVQFLAEQKQYGNLLPDAQVYYISVLSIKILNISSTILCEICRKVLRLLCNV